MAEVKEELVSKRGAVNLGRLRRAMSRSIQFMQPYQVNRTTLIEQYTGPNWSTTYDQQLDNERLQKRRYSNLAASFVQIVWRQLVSKSPRVQLSVFQPEYKPTVHKVQEEANLRFERMGLADVLQRATLDAMFTVGVVKVGLCNPGVSAAMGNRVRSGEVFASVVGLDDFLFDVTAKSFDECQWFAHRYRIPLDVAKEMKDDFDNAGVRKELTATDPQRYTQLGDLKASFLGRVTASDGDEAEPMVNLWEVYFPRYRKLITIPDEFMFGGNDESEEPLGERDWVGPYCGPYHFLAFNPVPENPMPLAPLQLLRDMDALHNNVWRKLAMQAKRMKSVGVYRQKFSTDADAIAKTSDGGTVGVEEPDSIQEKVFGGPHPVLAQFADITKQQFNWLSGNIELNAGLAPQSKTASQDKMLNANASRLLTDMQETAVEFVADVSRSLCWYISRDPFTTYQGTRNLGVPGIDIPTQVTPEERAEVPWDDVDIRVDPYSLRHQTPGEKLGFLNSMLDRFVPLMPLLQQQGVVLNIPFLLKKFAEYGDSPDLPEMFTIQEPPAPVDGESGATELPHDQTLPSNTTRTYNRISSGGETGGNRASAVERMAQSMGSSMNGSMGPATGE